MTSSSATRHGAVDDLDHASIDERAPLLRRTTTDASSSLGGAAGSPLDEGIPASLKRRISLLLCAFAFAVMFGENMQPAARTQLYEDVICQQYYGDAVVNGTAAVLDDPARCKILPIQKELALVRGIELFTQVFPTLILAVPFGRLADRIGRKRVMAINIGASILTELFTLVICWRSDIFPIRAVWLSVVFMFAAGGASVSTTLIHVMTADFADEAERTRIFVYLHASTVMSAFLAPMASAALMEQDRVWTAILVGEAIMIVTLVLLIPAIPETLHLRDRFTSVSSDESSSVSSSSSKALMDPPLKQSAGVADRVKATIDENIALFSGKGQTVSALLLLAIYIPVLLGRDAFPTVGLQYAWAKFSLQYSRGNFLLSLYQAVQGTLMLIIIPAVTYLASVYRHRYGANLRPENPLNWSANRRDRYMMTGSLTLMAAGHLLLFLAPSLPVSVIGIICLGLAATAGASVLSLLAECVRAEDVSATFSLAVMLSSVTGNGLAPVAMWLFNVGTRWGRQWAGLPFALCASLTGLGAIGGLFVRGEKGKSRERARAGGN